MEFLALTWPKALSALALFAVVSYAVPVGWDALGMGFMKLRFKLWHIWLIVMLGAFAMVRGRGGNGRLVQFGGAMLLGLLAACYLLACLGAWIL